jgi:host factor-I protein
MEMAMSTPPDTTKLQHDFLAELTQKKSPVAVYLKNGIKLKGTIRSFDEQSILLDHPSMQIIYKTAVSTVAPLLTFYSGEPILPDPSI